MIQGKAWACLSYTIHTGNRFRALPPGGGGGGGGVEKGAQLAKRRPWKGEHVKY